MNINSLRETLSFLQSIMGIITLIINGKSKTQACKAFEFDRMRFDTVLNRITMLSDSIKNKSDKIKYTPTPAERIYADVFGIKLNDDTIKDVPLGIDDNVPIALSYLDEREADILIERYYDEKKPTTIAKTRNVSARRIQYIINDSLRKLRRFEPQNIMKYGKETAQEEVKLRQINDKRTKSEYVQNLENRIDKALMTHDIEALTECYDRVTKALKELNEYTKVDASIVDISVLDLPGKTELILRENGINKISDLNGYNDNTILTLFGIGVRKATMIFNRLKMLNAVDVNGTVDTSVILKSKLQDLYELQKRRKRSKFK